MRRLVWPCMEVGRREYLDLANKYIKIARKRFDQHIKNMPSPHVPILD